MSYIEIVFTSFFGKKGNAFKLEINNSFRATRTVKSLTKIASPQVDYHTT